MSEQVDLNRLRRQVAFDRLLARLFVEEPPPWVLKGGYALELRFKAARSTVDIDLTVQRVPASAVDDQNQIVRDMLQTAAAVPLGDWLEFAFGPPAMDLTAAPHGGARYPVEARVDDELVFYAQSRGLTRREATRMIVAGFFQQVFDRIMIDSVREALGEAIRRRVREYE